MWPVEIVVDTPYRSGIAVRIGCTRSSVQVSRRPAIHGSVGDAYYNAMCESFFAILECELLDQRKYQTEAKAKMAIFEFIEG